jgi:uncharacterized lipoprotein YbaY
MKFSPIFFLATLGVLLAATACSSIDLTPEGDPQREIKGTINLRSDLALPPDTVVVVRVIDRADVEQTRAAASSDLPVMSRAKPAPIERVLGEKTIAAPTAMPIPFQVEFSADDSLMRHGLNLDVRVSFGGRVQYRTVSSYLLTLSSFGYNHEVWVEAAAR